MIATEVDFGKNFQSWPGCSNDHSNISQNSQIEDLRHRNKYEEYLHEQQSLRGSMKSQYERLAQRNLMLTKEHIEYKESQSHLQLQSQYAKVAKQKALLFRQLNFKKESSLSENYLSFRESVSSGNKTKHLHCLKNRNRELQGQKDKLVVRRKEYAETLEHLQRIKDQMISKAQPEIKPSNQQQFAVLEKSRRAINLREQQMSKTQPSKAEIIEKSKRLETQPQNDEEANQSSNTLLSEMNLCEGTPEMKEKIGGTDLHKQKALNFHIQKLQKQISEIKDSILCDLKDRLKKEQRLNLKLKNQNRYYNEIVEGVKQKTLRFINENIPGSNT